MEKKPLPTEKIHEIATKIAALLKENPHLLNKESGDDYFLQGIAPILGGLVGPLISIVKEAVGWQAHISYALAAFP